MFEHDNHTNEGYRRFRQAMQNGKLQAGMVVTQNELCELLGLSLSPLRETLALLEEFGLVEIKPRTGIRIVYPEVAFIRENYQFRIMIELHALRAFIDVVPDGWVEDMRASHRAFQAELQDGVVSEDTVTRIIDLDRRMHRNFVEALDNRAILDTHTRLQENIGMARKVHQRAIYRTQLIDTMDEHMRLLAALENRDLTPSIEALEAHFRASTHRTFAAR